MTNKRETDSREDDLVALQREGYTDQNHAGEAYAFFDCEASMKEIEGELPTIRNLVQTPNELELQLMEGTDALEGDSQIGQIAREAKDAGLKYAIQATFPNGTNEQTADEVAGILNQAYQSPLYQEGEPFRGGVFYEQNGKFVSRE
jgi:hypothetical protein